MEGLDGSWRVGSTWPNCNFIPGPSRGLSKPACSHTTKQGWVSQPAPLLPSRIKPACRHTIKKEVVLSSEWDSASLLP